MTYSYVNTICENVSWDCSIREPPNSRILAKIKFSLIIVDLQYVVSDQLSLAKDERPHHISFNYFRSEASEILVPPYDLRTKRLLLSGQCWKESLVWTFSLQLIDCWYLKLSIAYWLRPFTLISIWKLLSVWKDRDEDGKRDFERGSMPGSGIMPQRETARKHTC